MKMAKAGEEDMRMALDLAGALESLERYGYFPEQMRPVKDEDSGPNRFDRENAKHCKEALNYLIELSETASLFRVVLGMTVLLDPRNEVVDPNANTLEIHPKYKAQSAEIARLRVDANRYRHMRDRNSSLEAAQRDRGIVNGPSCYHIVGDVRELKHGEELDAAIDAALRGDEGKQA